MPESQPLPGKIISYENFRLAKKLTAGQAQTRVVYRKSVDQYFLAGQMSGCIVSVVAEEGGEFPHIQDPKLGVRLNKVTREDWVAISIEKPEGEKDFGLYEMTLGNILGQEKTKDMPEPK